MKKYIFNLLLLAFLFCVTACSDDDLGPSIFDTTTEELTELDLWMQKNFVEPYNIEVIYKWRDVETSMEYNLTPPKEDNAKGLADVLLNIWCKPYVEIGGESFFKSLSPKQLLFIGSSRYTSSGTVTKGTAEGGRKIVIFEVDQYDRTNATRLKRYMKTIHHEFAHIAAQTVEYPKEFENITPNYVEGWDKIKDQDAYDQGFLSGYAMSEPGEDFAEIVGFMLSNSAEDWEKMLDYPTSQEAKDKLKQKVEMVVIYYRDTWNVDLYALQAECEQALYDVVNGVTVNP